MDNPWKLATIGLSLVGVTALSTGLTTAYVMRGPERLSSAEASAPVAATAPLVAPSAPVVRTTSAPVHVRSAVATRPPAVTHAVTTRPAVLTPVATDCSTGADRAMKIAKPGLIGTLAGAGLGAIGGAIADGGSGAGKGALIGGLAGAAAGGGYGAYKTKQECGTIFGSTSLAGF